MNMLGGDLALRTSGLVLLDNRNKLLWSRLLRSPSSARGMPRLVWLLNEFGADVTQLEAKFGPFHAVLEDVAYAAPNMRVTIMLAEWLTIAKLVLHAHKIDFDCIPVQTARKWFGGRGDIDKAFVAERLKTKHHLAFASDPGYDLSDAALLALWGNR